MNQLRPELDNVLQCLSLNGYSVLSLIDDIHARCNLNREDERIKTLREGMERDAADICARLLCRITSGPATVLKIGNVQCTCSSSNVGSHTTITDFACIVKIHRHVVPIDMLPDDVLLDIFDSCLCDPIGFPASNWQTLVHVCQRWRRLVFASPRRLNLYLKCSSGTPVRTNLPFWPVTLPLIVDYHLSYHDGHDSSDEDDIVAVLGHSSRVHRITICGEYPLIKKVVTPMRESFFPALTPLDLGWNFQWPTSFPVISPGFLGKSAASLQYLRLSYISFPRLPTFLLSESARNLVTLKLEEIQVPPKGYLPPKAMVGSLAALTRLTTLSISFHDYGASFSHKWKSYPDSFMRSVLPALTNFHYKGRSEFLEHFLTQIDTPLLDNLTIEYVFLEIEFPQLSRFIGRTENLQLYQFTRAELTFLPKGSYFKLDRPQGKRSLSLNILSSAYIQTRMQVWGMARLLGQLPAMFSNVNDLFAHGDHLGSSEIDAVASESAGWQVFFDLFPAVKKLDLSEGVAPCITSALDEMYLFPDVLPVLRSIRFIKDEDESEDENEDFWNKRVASMNRFLSSRQKSGFPVTVINPGGMSIEPE